MWRFAESVVTWLARWLTGPGSGDPLHGLAPDGPSHIAAGLHFRGDVTGEGDLVVSGCITGDVRVDGIVLVDPGGDVEGEIEADTIVIAGAVLGDVTAATRVDMLRTGRLAGMIKGGAFAAADGARVRAELQLGGVPVPVPERSEGVQS